MIVSSFSLMSMCNSLVLVKTLPSFIIIASFQKNSVTRFPCSFASPSTAAAPQCIFLLRSTGPTHLTNIYRSPAAITVAKPLPFLFIAPRVFLEMMTASDDFDFCVHVSSASYNVANDVSFDGVGGLITAAPAYQRSHSLNYRPDAAGSTNVCNDVICRNLQFGCCNEDENSTLNVAGNSFGDVLQMIRSIKTNAKGEIENDVKPLSLNIDLSLCSREVEDGGVATLAKEISALSQHNKHVKILKLLLPGMGLSHLGMKAISSVIKDCATEISLSYNYLRNEGVAILSDALCCNLSEFGLQTLKLENVGMDNIGLGHLENAFKNNASMQTLCALYLGDNNLRNANSGHGLHDLSRLLKENPQIETISLFATNLGNDGVDILAEELQKRRVVHLGRNNIGDVGAAILGKIIANTSSLEEFRVNGNPIGNTRGWKSLSAALKINTSLNFLDLTNCEIEDNGAISLASSIPCNTSLKQVILRGNYNIDESGIQSLIRCLFDTTSISGILKSNHTITNFDFYSSIAHSKLLRKLQSLCQSNQQLGPVYSCKEKMICCFKTKPWWISCLEMDNGRVILPSVLEMFTIGRCDLTGTLFDVLKSIPQIFSKYTYSNH